MDLLAAATIALAIATVFGKEIRIWLIKPRIRLYGDITARYVVRSPNEWLDNLERGPQAPTPFPKVISVPAGEIAPWYWIRMEIGNCRYLSDTAQELEIFLLEIQEIDRFGQFRTLPNVGLNLCWSWGTDTLFTHILPGGKKFFNLGHVVHPDERLNHPLLLKAPETRNKAFFTLASFPRNPGYEGGFEAKTYRLHLLIGGKNVRPKRYWVRFDFQNEWTRDVDDMCGSLSLKIE